MPAACRVTDKMLGEVSEHGGHPVWGHVVHGVQTTGSPSMFINGLATARHYDTGNTDCPDCDGPYTNANAFNTERSKALFVNGKGIVRVGDTVNIHDQGYGSMITGSHNFFVNR